MSILDWLGTGNQRRAVERLLIKLINQKELLEASRRNDRESSRVPVVLEARVVPWDGKHPVMQEAFLTTTRDITLSGLSVVASGPLPLGSEVVTSIYVEGDYHHLLCRIRHATPLGPESFLIGLEASRQLPSSHELRVIHSADELTAGNPN
jgi:hypothetical protein